MKCSPVADPHLRSRVKALVVKVSFIRRTKNTVRALMDGRVRCLDAVLPFVEGKAGLEIGGPSAVFEQGLRPDADLSPRRLPG